METTNNFDYLMTGADTAVLKNLSQMGSHLKELKEAMVKAEAAAVLAKQEYEHYANNIMPSAMHAAGVDSLELAEGGKLKVSRNYYCSPNKNEADRKIIVNWLREQGGDYLIKSTATVDPTSIDELKKLGIPYAENTAVNTASLKSFIKDKLGITTGTAQLQMEDIPKCIHFCEVTTVDFDM